MDSLVVMEHQPWTRAANEANKRLVLHVRTSMGMPQSHCIVTPGQLISRLNCSARTSELRWLSVTHCGSWGFERLRKFEDSKLTWDPSEQLIDWSNFQIKLTESFNIICKKKKSRQLYYTHSKCKYTCTYHTRFGEKAVIANTPEQF